jgi:uncharacterized protein (DUF2249 family)
MKNRDARSANSEETVRLDLRVELAQAPERWEPLSRIMWTASQLGSGQVLKLLAPFEPVLLTRVLAAQGFSHQTEHSSAGHWEVSVRKGTEFPDDDVQGDSGAENRASFLELDLRGVKDIPSLFNLVEALSQLPETTELVVVTDHPPVTGELPEHCRCVTVEPGKTQDGSFRTRIQLSDE